MIVPLFESSLYNFPKFFFAISLTIQKWQAVQYLIIFNTFLLQHPMKFIRFTFEILFKNTTITTNFLKSHIFNTCSIELRTLFAIFNKKNWGISNSDQARNGWWLMESLSRYKCNEVGYTELVFQKRWLFSWNTCSYKRFSSEKVAVWKKYLLRKSTCFEELLILKK